MAVKDNRKKLSQAIVEFFDTAEAFDFRNIAVQKNVCVEKDHGRIETRRAVFVPDVSWMDKLMREGWKKRSAVGMIESAQDIKGKVSIDRRYFILSAGVKTVEQFAHAARAHWGVESMHWVPGHRLGDPLQSSHQSICRPPQGSRKARQSRHRRM